MIIDDNGTVEIASIKLYKNMPYHLFQQEYGSMVRGRKIDASGFFRFKDLIADNNELSYRIIVAFTEDRISHIELYPVSQADQIQHSENLMKKCEESYEICRKILINLFGEPDSIKNNDDVFLSTTLKQIQYCRNGIIISSGVYYNPREGWPSGGSIYIGYD